MTRKLLVMACCVLASASVFAQSRSAKSKADPITGTWTGTLTRENGARPIPVTMELKFDGKTAVTGTVAGMPNPADVKAGTFDPKKGTLKLELGKQGEPAVLLVLEGTVVKGTATGRFSGDLGGEFKLSKQLAKPPTR
jgi:hypothetical protein